MYADHKVERKDYRIMSDTNSIKLVQDIGNSKVSLDQFLLIRKSSATKIFSLMSRINKNPSGFGNVAALFKFLKTMDALWHNSGRNTIRHKGDVWFKVNVTRLEALAILAKKEKERKQAELMTDQNGNKHLLLTARKKTNHDQNEDENNIHKNIDEDYKMNDVNPMTPIRKKSEMDIDSPLESPKISSFIKTSIRKPILSNSSEIYIEDPEIQELISSNDPTLAQKQLPEQSLKQLSEQSSFISTTTQMPLSQDFSQSSNITNISGFQGSIQVNMPQTTISSDSHLKKQFGESSHQFSMSVPGTLLPKTPSLNPTVNKSSESSAIANENVSKTQGENEKISQPQDNTGIRRRRSLRIQLKQQASNNNNENDINDGDKDTSTKKKQNIKKKDTKSKSKRKSKKSRKSSKSKKNKNHKKDKKDNDDNGKPDAMDIDSDEL